MQRYIRNPLLFLGRTRWKAQAYRFYNILYQFRLIFQHLQFRANGKKSENETITTCLVILCFNCPVSVYPEYYFIHIYKKGRP